MPSDPIPGARVHRIRVGVGAAVILVIAALGIAVLVSALASAGGSRTVIGAARGVDGAATSIELDPDASVIDERAPTIFVHILGEVRRPGLYELRDGARVVDAVAAAGGYTDDADRALLNLARFVSDGEQLVVYAEGEAPTAGAGAAVGPGVTTVNINTADAATLATLPRIGPALAQRIVDWRTEHGRFTALEDLMSVSGIGQKTFAGLAGKVTL